MFPAIFDLLSLDGSNGFTIDGIDPMDFLGRAVSNAEDINGDGIDDIVISAFEGDPNGVVEAGEVYILFGSSTIGDSGQIPASQLDGKNGFVINGIRFADRAGSVVSNAGDINGDGFGDVIIGAPESRNIDVDPVSPYAGEVYVVFGGSSVGRQGSLDLSSLDGNNGFRIEGIDKYDVIGFSISNAGDFNGDGFDDFLIGKNPFIYGDNRIDPDNDYSGEAYLIFGSSRVGEQATVDLSALDGHDGFIINGINFKDYAGRSVNNAGDINGDGFDDLLIGAPGADPKGIDNAGQTYVVFGGKRVGKRGFIDLENLDGTNGFVINGKTSFDQLGSVISNAGDINSDGFDDFILGTPRSDPMMKSSAGQVYVVLGDSQIGSQGEFDLSALEGPNGFVINGLFENDQLGSNVSSAGDINGDGFDDILFTASYDNSANVRDVGQSYVVFGGSNISESGSFNLSDLDGRSGFIIPGISFALRSVSNAGDVNNDGIEDILLGSPNTDLDSQMNVGQGYVIFGQKIDINEGNRTEGSPKSDFLKGSQDNDIILGKAGSDTLLGFAGNDRLLGNGGDDLLVGGRGDDRLISGNGHDTLTGGSGMDKFVFKSFRHKADRILDFNVSNDLILLRQPGFDLDFPNGKLARSRFTIGRGASDRSDRLIYNNQTGALLFDVDGIGKQAARVIAFLHQRLDLTAANIRII